MPKTKRDLLKRRMGQAHNNVQRALADVKDLHETFSPSHPLYAEYLEAIAICLIEVQKMMLNFWVHAWGKPPKDITKWKR